MEVLPEYLVIEKALQKHPLVFVTGEAGTGKSTFIRYLAQKTENLVVVAPVAISALNVKGVTIHSFFGFPATHITPEEFSAKSKLKMSRQKKELLDNTKILVIDEVSMLLPNILDSIHKILQIIKQNDKPFGGVSVVLVGDLLQLPPIVASSQERSYFSHRYQSAYFFSADIFNEIALTTFQLTLVKRQKDQELIKILSCIRINNNHRAGVALLNNRCYLQKKNKPLSPYATYLVTTNYKAKAINKQKLNTLRGKSVFFEARITGSASIEQWRLPASYLLELRLKARVMFLKNNKPQWLNGDFGEVVELTDNTIFVRKSGDEEVLEVKRTLWDKYQYTYERSQQRILKKLIGSFKQFPLALGWASTIHKTQGLTLSETIIDLSKGAFCTGQTYVALSRCRSLAGITLQNPIAMRDVKADNFVINFLEQLLTKKLN